MASKDDKFNMTITFGYKITKLDADGKAAPFTNFGPTDLEYKNMDYQQITETQKQMMGLGQSLIDLGEAEAEVLKGKK